MKSQIELIYSITYRIDTLASLDRIQTLLHHHYSTKNLPKNFKNLDEVYKSQTTLYILIVSYLYTLFDESGTNINVLNEASLSQSLRDKRNEILELWKPLENPITRIRHNFGFHGGGLSQIRNVIKASKEIDRNDLLPIIVELLDKLKHFSFSLKSEFNLTEMA